MYLLIFMIFFCYVVLITGGYQSGGGHTVQIFNPITKKSCSLPELPEDRHHHSEDGGLLCGGPASTNTSDTCVQWSPTSGTWNHSHTLTQWRYGHVSWATPSGVYLIGGVYNSRTSERVKLDGSVEEGFSLKNNTM